MKFHHITIDEFLERPDSVREWALAQEFKTVVSPADGLEYPGIVTPLPDILLSEVIYKLSLMMGEVVSHQLSFFRLTTKGYKPYAWIHTDPRIADWIAVTYMNPGCEDHKTWWGTGMYEHKTEKLTRSPRNAAEQAIWERCCKDELTWRLVGWVHARYNRTVILNTHTLHAAHPQEGAGEDSETGRLVMVNFFNLRIREEPCVQPQQQPSELPLQQSLQLEPRSLEP
jgi:Family of unknown function (DUF6445)